MKKHLITHTISCTGISCCLAAAITFQFLISGAGCRLQPSDSSKKAPVSSGTFSVAFYNVENLFDNEFDGNEYPEYRPDAANWNQEMHRRKFENIASVIAALDASIIALCEVEDRDALDQLRTVLKKKGCSYPYHAIIDTPAISNTTPALLSRFPVKNASLHPVALSDTFSTRGILEADIAVQGRALKIFVNHWPSKKHQESFRLAAADTLLSIISRLPEHTDYIIAGDFNADYNEFSTFTTFGHNNTGGITGINHRLGTIQPVTPLTSRLRDKNDVIAAPFPSHYDLWMELPEMIRMSYVFKGNRQTPDHILLPPALFDTSGISYVDNSFTSFTWGSRLLDHGKPTGWKMRYKGNQKLHVGEGYSDHLPLMALFTSHPFAFDTSSIDFGDALRPENGNPDSWFEYHNSGWISCDNSVSYSRDTSNPYDGLYALHAVAPGQKESYTALKAVIKSACRNKKGALALCLRGSGNICIRTKNGNDKWQYLNFSNGTLSGRATYTPFQSVIWQTVTVPSSLPPDKDIELELRSAKDVPLDLWIDR